MMLQASFQIWLVFQTAHLTASDKYGFRSAEMPSHINETQVEVVAHNHNNAGNWRRSDDQEYSKRWKIYHTQNNW